MRPKLEVFPSHDRGFPVRGQRGPGHLIEHASDDRRSDAPAFPVSADTRGPLPHTSRVRCLVTAGPTYEPLDQVRRLTNFSTGRLGSELAAHLAAAGHEVTLLLGEAATHPAPGTGVSVIRFSHTGDLGERLRALASPEVQAVFHAAAVSDFRFGRVWSETEDGGRREVQAGKINSGEPRLLAELVPTPKLIGSLRDWFPAALLAGWKYEVDGERGRAVGRGLRQIAKCRTDVCVVNGPAFGEGFGVLLPGGGLHECPGREALFRQLTGLLKSGR